MGAWGTLEGEQGDTERELWWRGFRGVMLEGNIGDAGGGSHAGGDSGGDAVGMMLEVG